MLKNQDFTKANEALKIASTHGHPSSETIQQVYHQLIHGRGLRPTLNIKSSITEMPVATRGVHQYDAFFSQGRGQLE